MEKLKFEFQVKASLDGKSNYIAITSITTQDGKQFLIPEEYQVVSLHKHVYSSKTFVMVKSTLKKRHQVRNIWIKLTEDLLKTYVDEDGNMIFQDQFLEETSVEQTSKKDPEDPIVKILEKLVKNQEKKEKQSMKQLAERFILQKFDGKGISAYNWVELFEKECSRYDISQEIEKI